MRRFFAEKMENLAFWLDPKYKSSQSVEDAKRTDQKLDQFNESIGESTEQIKNARKTLEKVHDDTMNTNKKTKDAIYKSNQVLHREQYGNNYNCKIELKAVKEGLENGSECTPMLEKLKQCIEMSANMQKQIASHK